MCLTFKCQAVFCSVRVKFDVSVCNYVQTDNVKPASADTHSRACGTVSLSFRHLLPLVWLTSRACATFARPNMHARIQIQGRTSMSRDKIIPVDNSMAKPGGVWVPHSCCSAQTVAVRVADSQSRHHHHQHHENVNICVGRTE